MSLKFAPSDSKILIVGLSAGGPGGVSEVVRRRIADADALAGGVRHLSYFPEFKKEKIVISSSVEPVAQRLRRLFEEGKKAVVLASGDPLWHGVGASLRRFFAAESLEIIPSPTAFQLAFAALAEPWHDAVLVSMHGRSDEGALRQAADAKKAAILTDNSNTPSQVAQKLIGFGASPVSECAVCENLGAPNERIIRLRLGELVECDFAPLNVLVVWPQPMAETKAASGTWPPGLPDKEFSTSNEQITKREIRLLSLAELALEAGDTLWDIGAGSGSVGIEAARANPNISVFAIERRAQLCAHIRENLRRFPARNFHLYEGVAPNDCLKWPRPNAVFIGGGGGELSSLLQLTRERLLPGGRIVINLATVENLSLARNLMPKASVHCVQISRGAPILEMLRFEALNPVFMVIERKEAL